MSGNSKFAFLHIQWHGIWPLATGFTFHQFMSLDFITLNISSILEQLVHWSQTANQKRNSQSHRNDSWLLRNCWLTLPNWSYLIIDFSPKLFFFTIWICLNIWGAWSHQIQIHSSGRQILCSPNVTFTSYRGDTNEWQTPSRNKIVHTKYGPGSLSSSWQFWTTCVFTFLCV